MACPEGPDWPGQQYSIAVPDAVLLDLKERLLRTRLPDRQADADWMSGTPLDYARRLRDHWLLRFDWREQERRLNRIPQRMIDVDGHQIHVLVERGSGRAPLPLLLLHGWPSSFVEFAAIVDRLAHPEKYGGNADDAFTVIIPGMPGYGFSPPPAAPLSPDSIARLWSRMMTDVFGFDRYVGFGCDWGSAVLGAMALNDAPGLSGILMTTPGVMVEIAPDDAPLRQEESEWLSRMQARMAPESGYQIVQATKPQSLAYGLNDSPMGLACWIVEKFHGWTTPGIAADPPFSMDDLLSNVMIYWVNGCLAPMWLYRFMGTRPIPWTRSTVPAGFFFPANDVMPPPPQSYLERLYDVGYYHLLGQGGHFPGLEMGDFLTAEIQAYLGQFRSRA